MKNDKGSWIGRGRQPMVAVCVERHSGYGRVPGLEDEELADAAELERQVVLDEWGPILALPVCKNGSWIRPDIDEKGNYDWGAFGTHDFERLYGGFDKARFKIDKLREELRNEAIMMEIHAPKIPGPVIDVLTKGLRNGTINLGDLEDIDQYFFAWRYLRARRIKAHIARLWARGGRPWKESPSYVPPLDPMDQAGAEAASV